MNWEWKLKMIRMFQKGIDEVAQIDINKHYSFVSIGKQNIEEGRGFTVKSFLVCNAYLCQKLLESKSGKGWRIKV